MCHLWTHSLLPPIITMLMMIQCIHFQNYPKHSKPCPNSKLVSNGQNETIMVAFISKYEDIQGSFPAEQLDFLFYHCPFVPIQWSILQFTHIKAKHILISAHKMIGNSIEIYSGSFNSNSDFNYSEFSVYCFSLNSFQTQ